MKDRLFFILSLWMVIGVAMLSALAPMGAPSSRLTGSAFNPATTSVVLKARARAVPVAAHMPQPDGNRRVPLAASLAICLFFLAPMLMVGRFHPAQRFSRTRSLPRPSHLLSRRHARAPPALS